MQKNVPIGLDWAFLLSDDDMLQYIFSGMMPTIDPTFGPTPSTESRKDRIEMIKNITYLLKSVLEGYDNKIRPDMNRRFPFHFTVMPCKSMGLSKIILPPRGVNNE